MGAKTNKTQPVYLMLSFVFPCAILGAAFALNRVFPFGNRQIITHDFFHQYYPFLSSLWHKLREGGLSPWSWISGAGHDYTALMAYYMASPLNLIALLPPHAWLRETLTLVLLIKIGCAGLCTALFVRQVFKQQGPAVPVFACLYALCAYTLGYYWNIMWFDGFALMPLVILGLLALMREGRYRLYVISLALAVLANFYMGFFVCLFTAMVFCIVSIINNIKGRVFFTKLGLVAAYSILALGIAAVVLIPSFRALQTTNSADTAFPHQIGFLISFFDILGNFIAFTPPTYSVGLPNLYCGMISILLAGLYFATGKIALREKLALAGTLAFLIICCNHSVLYYMIHGFRLPNMLPARFSFLISFILVIMAYRAFILITKDSINGRSLAAMGSGAALFLVMAAFGIQEYTYIIGSLVICIIYIALLYAYSSAQTVKTQKAVQITLFVIVLTELAITSFIGVRTVGTTGRDEYIERHEQIQALLNMRRPDNPAFYRTEINRTDGDNNPSLYNYNGIDFFSTIINANVVNFMHGLGLYISKGKSTHFLYRETTPLADAFLNMRYVIAVGENQAGIYWHEAGEEGDARLYENIRYLPLGFIAQEDITGYAHSGDNPFLSQNDLFRRATGLDADLFLVTDLINDPSVAKDIEEYWVTCYYQMPYDGFLYSYCEFINDTRGFLSGFFYEGEIVPIRVRSGTFIYTGLFNIDLFEQGYHMLASQPYTLTQFSNTKVSGNVTALQDGVLYTSIPGKNWSVFVNGVKSELLLIDNAMAAVRLREGTHTVEFRYRNMSLAVGAIISAVCLLLFTAFVFHNSIIKRRRQ